MRLRTRRLPWLALLSLLLLLSLSMARGAFAATPVPDASAAASAAPAPAVDASAPAISPAAPPALKQLEAVILGSAASTTATQPAAPASVPLAQSLDQVIQALQNDRQRKALVDQLRKVRRGLGASAAAASEVEAPAPGLVGALAEAVESVDDSLRDSTGPFQYWSWRLGFARDEWWAAVTQKGTRSAFATLQVFATVLAAWWVAGWLLRELGRRVRGRQWRPAERPQLPPLPSWKDVGIFMLRRAGPWLVAFGLAVIITTKFHAHSPGSIAAMVVAYAIVAGALMSAVCQVVFALFRTAHRARAVRDLHQHSRGMLYFTGALAALGDAAADGRVIDAFGWNLSSAVATVSNILAALIIAAFVMRFRRQIGQIIALRPFSFRQAHPTIVDLLRLVGEAWHLPVLAVVFASVIGTLFAAGHADVILHHAMGSVALFVGALALTLLTGRSPKGHPVRSIRDRRRSAYLARFIRFAVALTRVVIWFSFLELCSRIWGFSLLDLAESTPLGKRIEEIVFSVTSTVLLTWLVWLVIDTAITQTLTPSNARASQPSMRARTILPLLRNALFIGLLVIGLIVVLANLGVNVTPLLAGAGVVGLAIGFGAQSLVQDLITGLFIVVEDSIAIGDSIELPDHAGAVEAMTIRTIKLRDGKGALHVLPYSQIKTVKNLSRGYAYAVFTITVSYDSDLDRAIELVRETGAELGRDFRYARNLLGGLEILGLDRFDPNGCVVMAQIKTRPLTQAEITRAFNARLKQKFDEADIRMATPYMTLRLRPTTADSNVTEVPEHELFEETSAAQPTRSLGGSRQGKAGT